MRTVFVLALLIFAAVAAAESDLFSPVADIEEEVLAFEAENETQDDNLEMEDLTTEESEFVSDLEEDLTACLSAGIEPALPKTSPAFNKFAPLVFRKNKAMQIAFKGDKKAFLKWVASGKAKGISIVPGTKGNVVKVVTWFKRNKLPSNSCIKVPKCKKTVVKKAAQLAKTEIKQLVKSGCGAGEAQALQKLGKSVVNKLAKNTQKDEKKVAAAVRKDIAAIKKIANVAANRKSSALKNAIAFEKKVRQQDAKLIATAKAQANVIASTQAKAQAKLDKSLVLAHRAAEQAVKEEKKLKKEDAKKIAEAKAAAQKFLKKEVKKIENKAQQVVATPIPVQRVAPTFQEKTVVVSKPTAAPVVVSKPVDPLTDAVNAAVKAAAAADEKRLTKAEQRSHKVNKLAKQVQAEARAAVAKFLAAAKKNKFNASVVAAFKKASKVAPNARALNRKAWKAVYRITLRAIKKTVLTTRKSFAKNSDKKSVKKAVKKAWKKAVRDVIASSVRHGIPRRIARSAARRASRNLRRKFLLRLRAVRHSTRHIGKSSRAVRKADRKAARKLRQKRKLFRAVYKSTKRAIRRAVKAVKKALKPTKASHATFRANLTAAWKAAVQKVINGAVRRGVNKKLAKRAAFKAARDLRREIQVGARRALKFSTVGNMSSEKEVKAYVQKRLEAMAAEGTAALAKFANELHMRMSEEALDDAVSKESAALEKPASK